MRGVQSGELLAGLGQDLLDGAVESERVARRTVVLGDVHRGWTEVVEERPAADHAGGDARHAGAAERVEHGVARGGMREDEPADRLGRDLVVAVNPIEGTMSVGVDPIG